MKTKKYSSKQSLKTIIKHLIKEELQSSFSKTLLVPALSHGFEEEGLELYSTIANAKGSKELTRAISDIIDEEYFPALKEKLIQRILEKLLSDLQEKQESDQ